MDRYNGKPFLRLLECYVLESVGMLTDDQRNLLTSMEPNLRKTFGLKGTWFEIVEQQMHFPNTLPDAIRGLWQEYLRAAEQQNVPPHPGEFAMMFVDRHFPEIFE